MFTESEKQAFKNNLSLVTSNSSLVKLDVVNEEVMERRHLLVAKRNRKLEAFSSAVLVYFCNVLNQRGYAAGSKEQFKSTLAVADVLTTGWGIYHASCVISDDEYSTIEQMSTWVEKKLKEAFSYGLNDTMRPTAYSLKYILDDFDRINKVSSLTK